MGKYKIETHKRYPMALLMQGRKVWDEKEGKWFLDETTTFVRTDTKAHESYLVMGWKMLAEFEFPIPEDFPEVDIQWYLDRMQNGNAISEFARLALDKLLREKNK